MTRLYLADLDAQFLRNVRKVVSRNHSIEVVGQAGDGRKAMEDMHRLQPDVLLTDIQLPGMDGLALLRESRRLRRPPSVIICTRFYPASCMDWCFRYGASYFLCKPIDCERLPELILDCAAERAPQIKESSTDDECAERVRSLLSDMGISSRLNGSAYLINSVLFARENDLLMKNLSHGLYRELASRMNTTVSRVERSLRSAIGVGYERGSLKDRFPGKPTNRQFIEYLLRETEESLLR